MPKDFNPQAQGRFCADARPTAQETLLWVTLDEPRIGAIVNVDGVRYRILGGNWTGTVARLQVERV